MQREQSDTIPVEYLRECFSYDREGGCLFWRRRPREHFASDWAYARVNPRQAGKKVGSLHSQGYLEVRLTFNGKEHLCLCHRICFAIEHGRWPGGQVDHINGIRTDNSVRNLRDSTSAENNQNRVRYKNNKSGFMGVVFNKSRGKFVAGIRLNRKSIHVGYFETAEEASAAYDAAKKEMHGFNPIRRDAGDSHRE